MFRLNDMGRNAVEVSALERRPANGRSNQYPIAISDTQRPGGLRIELRDRFGIPFADGIYLAIL